MWSSNCTCERMSRCHPWYDATEGATHRLRWQLSIPSSPTTEGGLSLCIDNIYIIKRDDGHLLDSKYDNWDRPHYVRQNILLNVTLTVKRESIVSVRSWIRKEDPSTAVLRWTHQMMPEDDARYQPVRSLLLQTGTVEVIPDLARHFLILVPISDAARDLGDPPHAALDPCSTGGSLLSSKLVAAYR